MTEHLIVADEHAMRVITLRRPEKKNAMSQKFMAELIKALKDIAENDKIKCVVTIVACDRDIMKIKDAQQYHVVGGCRLFNRPGWYARKLKY